MSEKPLLIMVDTNVWIDLYVPNRPRREESLAFFRASQRDGIELVFTLEIARAVFRIVSFEAKNWVRHEKGELPESFARAIARHSWDFIENMQEHGTPVGSSPADLWLASKLQDDHAEIEDDLIVAACMRIKADYLVTNDEQLMRHAPVAAVTPQMMAKLIETGIRT
ncbi:MAG TPA: hypothetical protein PK071_06495 [Atopobiaceae bacterium]|nr:hypothetical protein [Atopobiaceae bacterium]